MSVILCDDILERVFQFLFEFEELAANTSYPNVQARNRQLLTLQLVSKQFRTIIIWATFLWNTAILDLARSPISSLTQESLDALLNLYATRAGDQQFTLRLRHIEDNSFRWGPSYTRCNWCPKVTAGTTLPAIRLHRLKSVHTLDANIHRDDFYHLFQPENIVKLQEVIVMKLDVSRYDLDIGEFLNQLGEMPQLEHLCIRNATLFRRDVEFPPPLFTHIRKLELTGVGTGDRSFVARLLLYSPFLEKLVVRQPQVKAFRPALYQAFPPDQVHRHLEYFEFVDWTAVVAMTALENFTLPALKTLVVELENNGEAARKALETEIHSLFESQSLRIEVKSWIWGSEVEPCGWGST